jgi:hypothetical protein
MEAAVSKGFLIFAQNANNVDYIQQAYVLALSIKNSQHTVTSVSLVTNNTVPKKYKHAFDNIIPIPWIVKETATTLQAEHRWKLYHITPYEETFVLDADMLMLEDITEWWNYCHSYNVKYCSRIKNYKLETVVDAVHRKSFMANRLENPYAALHYFKKSDQAYAFYKVLEFVCNNWEWCYKTFSPNEYQPWLSMDLAVAITIEITGFYDVVLDEFSPLEFIHMKSPLQGWPLTPGSWQDGIHFVLNSKGELIVGNIKQSKLFHYVEKDFLTNDMITTFKGLVNEQ